MTPRTPLALALAAAVAAGCASRRAPATAAPPAAAERPLSAAAASAVKAAQAQDAATLVCRIERPTGSNIAKRVCRTREAIERDREAAQQLLLRTRGGRAPDS